METNSRIAEVRESYQSFNVMTKELRATEVLQMNFVSNVSHGYNDGHIGRSVYYQNTRTLKGETV